MGILALGFSLANNNLIEYSVVQRILNITYFLKMSHYLPLNFLIKQESLDFSAEAINICNFFSSSIGFNPYSCFFRFTLSFTFDQDLLGHPLHRLLCLASTFFPPNSCILSFASVFGF